MIKIIYGEKGTGKTKLILEAVNSAAKTANGNVVFISQKKTCSVDIDFNVRCIYTEDYPVSGLDCFTGFVDGLMAGNADIEYLFIDGLMRITDRPVADLKPFFAEADRLSEVYGVKLILTVSCSKQNLPDFLLKYAD